MIEIREPHAEDGEAIRKVHVTAFEGDGGDDVARLVELLCRREKAPVALVAADGSDIYGHVLFSPVAVADAPLGFRALGLAPLGVLPEFQNQGIGTRLCREGLERCRLAGFDLAVVLGQHGYYTRFGFETAGEHGFQNEFGADENFMAIELNPGAFEVASGLVKYAPEFAEAGCA